jgi:predicted AlkP superfamily pyrophosphatase or phosphodiesterase
MEPKRAAVFACRLVAVAVLSGACRPVVSRRLAPGRPAAAAGRRHVIVFSIDGLDPGVYLAPEAHGLKVPTLRALRQRALYSSGLEAVFPSVTAPGHATLLTGTAPREHGITLNVHRDTELGWYWYADELRGDTLLTAARAAGLRIAAIDWPTTIGAPADWLVPDVWRTGEYDLRQMRRALSSPGLLDRVAASSPGFWGRLAEPGEADAAQLQVARHVLQVHRPDLLLVHTDLVDSVRHEQGMYSAAAIAAIERTDTEIARLIAAARRAGTWERTTLFIVSDHGFADIQHLFRPQVLLRERGLVAVDPCGKITGRRARLVKSGAFAYVYEEPGGATAEEITAVFAGSVGPGRPLRRLYRAGEIAERGGDPAAMLALEASTGWGLDEAALGEAEVALERPAATHGYAPDQPAMRAAFLAVGPGIAPGRLAGTARLVDVAPTIAAAIGLSLPGARGRNLLAARRE